MAGAIQKTMMLDVGHKMKKWIIAFVLLVAVVGGGLSYLWWGPPKLRLVVHGNLAAAFAHDLHEFILQHEGRLPYDWSEFEKWQAQRDGKIRWPAEAANWMFELLPTPNDTTGHYPQYVRVIDPDIKDMEIHINRMIFNAHALHAMTNELANKTLSVDAGINK